MERDLWKLQQECEDIRGTQAEFAERLARLERRQDEDYRMKSLWKSPSPFPALLSSAVSLANSNQSLVDRTQGEADMEDFELTHEQESQFLSSLAIDDAEAPRRGASRANSVRFDDYIQNHWIHDSKSAVGSDYFPSSSRSVSQLGLHSLDTRSSSHRSDGIHMLSVSSSLPVNEQEYNAKAPNMSVVPPNLNQQIPMTFANGPTMPCFISCTLDAHRDLEQIAVICSGSTVSTIEKHVIQQLDVEDQIQTDTNRQDYIYLKVYFPDSSSQYISSSSISMPYITVKFLVIGTGFSDEDNQRRMALFIGSDVLAKYQADVIFSQSQLHILVDDGQRIILPFHKPDGSLSIADICTLHVNLSIPEQPPVIQEERIDQELPDSPNTGLGTTTPITQKTNGWQDSPKPSSAEVYKVNSSASDKSSMKSASGAIGEPRSIDKSPRNVAIQDDRVRPVPPSENIYKPPRLNSSWHNDAKSSSSQDTRNGNISGRYHNNSSTLPTKRGMKVLRSSRAASLGDINSSNGPRRDEQRDDAPKTSYPPGTYRAAKFNYKLDQGDVRKISGSSDNLSKGPRSPMEPMQSPQADSGRKRSSNVLGGATAFAWMNSAKPTT